MIVSLALLFTVVPMQAHGAKEKFERTKPHVNTGTTVNNVDDSLSGPKRLGGQRLAISFDGSDLVPVELVSSGLFESRGAYPSGRFSFALDGSSIGYLYPWLREFLAGRQSPRSGSIYFFKSISGLSYESGVIDYKEKDVRGFRDAVITEVTFPSLDASSKTPGYITVRVNARSIREVEAKDLKHQLNTEHKKWLPSNFRFNIDGLPCDGVTKVDSFTLKQKILEKHSSVPIPYPTIANLKLTISKADYKAWENWLNATGGVKKSPDLLSGSITLLSGDQREKIVTLNLSGVRLVSLREKEGGRFFEAELSVGKMSLKPT
ncbi:MAG: hypothetical protein WBD99_05770 [Thermodesulfobacteriota bacterium]